jgi:hypothetical protein
MRFGILSFLLLSCFKLIHGNDFQKKSLPELQSFPNEVAILDMRNSTWQYIHDTSNNATFDEVTGQKNWHPIKVGHSWERVGHDELRKGTVWLRTRVFIPQEFKNNTISFFCTAVGDIADLFVNGYQIGERIRYDWWTDNPGSVKIEMTNRLVFGKENEILIRCGIQRPNRSIGLLGLVALQRSIPFYRNSNGGIVIGNDNGGTYNVLLHYGDAVLTSGNKAAFTAKELSSLRIPVYALREDELISVVPSGQVNISKKHRVDLSLVHYTSDDRTVTIKCDQIKSSLDQFELITIPIKLTGNYKNPFEQKEIEVSAEIMTPSGKVEKIHGYFAQDYQPVSVGDNEEILLPVKGIGTPWRLNYRPRDSGKYKIYLHAKDKNGEASFYAGSFEVRPKVQRGYLRVSKKDPRYFEFENGESFYATGPSGWYRQTENWIFGGNTRWVPVEQVRKFYQRKAENRSTYEYLARWHFGPLYLKDGFIDGYVAWKLESAIRSMESNGIYWITYGRPASGRTYFNNYKWGINTMSLQSQIIRQNGLPTLTELGFDQGGRIELYHFISRFADSPAIWLWNCAEEDGAFNPEVLPYHSYIRSIDVYKHPHGVSEGVDGIKYGGDAIILPDWYNGSYEKCLQAYLPFVNYKCPVIDIEGSVNDALDLYNMKGESLAKIENGYHNHLWMCLFMKMAGGGTDWFNVELDANNLMFHSKAISKYLDGESLTKPQWEIAKPVVSATGLDAFALKSANQTMAWIVRPPGNLQSMSMTDFHVTIPVMKNAVYQVEFWDTYSGEVIKKTREKSSDGKITVKVDGFKKDIALKVKISEP